jgi:hypothetical protein
MGVVIGLIVAVGASRAVRSAAAAESDRRALLALVVLVVWTVLLAAPRSWTARIGPAAVEAAPEGAAEEQP